MHKLSRITRLIAAVLLLLTSFLCNFAQATDDVDYSTIGWWQIRFREVDNLPGCYADAQFQDQTNVMMALLESDGSKTWLLYISNPKWSTWITRQQKFRLLMRTTKLWHGDFSRNEDTQTLFAEVSTDFMNSIADANSIIIGNEKGSLLTRLNMKDTDAAIRAVVNCVRDHPPKSTPTSEAQTTISGTAFFVAHNLLVTNDHVVKECGNDIQVRYPERETYTATISARDETNDLALLRTDMTDQSIVSFRFQPRLGESVATYGFPYSGVLSSGGNFTLGNITSLNGMNDDSRFIQISTPIQPGNSGGPLLDMSGRIVGVVEGTLNAIAMMQVGSIPQNVNFAIQAPIVVNFLSTKGVTPKLDSPGLIARRDLQPSEVADMAKTFTVQIYCQKGSPKTSAVPATERPPAPAPERPAAAVEQRAKDFVVSIEARWSGPNGEALAGLDSLYSDEVMYYGKLTKKDAVIKEKRAFAQRFPEREYKPKEPISVWCRDHACTVWGRVDFRAVDPVAQILSAGEASFVYDLVMSETTVIISLESGEVISRTRTSLSGAGDSH